MKKKIKYKLINNCGIEMYGGETITSVPTQWLDVYSKRKESDNGNIFRCSCGKKYLIGAKIQFFCYEV